MKSYPVPTVSWFPGDASARVVSADVLPRAYTVGLFHNVFTGADPHEICLEYRVTPEEFCVAILYELKQRKRTFPPSMTRYVLSLLEWAEQGVKDMKQGEDVSWPAPRYEVDR